MIKFKNVEIGEAELVEIIDRVVKLLASKFKYGYHDIEDMMQNGRLYALEALPLYDGVRKLDGFLYVHVRNRFINDNRDYYYKPTPPCVSCPFHDKTGTVYKSHCGVFQSRSDCEKYSLWEQKNRTKKALMNLKTIDNGSEGSTSSEFLNLPENIELLRLIDEKLCPEDRRLFLMVKNKVPIPTVQYRKLVETIREILGLGQ